MPSKEWYEETAREIIEECEKTIKINKNLNIKSKDYKKLKATIIDKIKLLKS